MWKQTSGEQLLCKLGIPSISLWSNVWIARSNLSPAHVNKDGVFIIVWRNSWDREAGKHLCFQNKYAVGLMYFLSFFIVWYRSHCMTKRGRSCTLWTESCAGPALYMHFDSQGCDSQHPPNTQPNTRIGQTRHCQWQQPSLISGCNFDTMLGLSGMFGIFRPTTGGPHTGLGNFKNSQRKVGKWIRE